MVLFIIAVAVVFLASIIAFFVLNSKAAVNNMKLILFYLLFAVIITTSGFIVFVSAVTSSMVYFAMTQCLFFALGYLVFYLLKKNFFGELEHEKWSKVTYVLAVASLGMIGFSLLFNHFSTTELAPYYSVSVVTFVMPQFLSISFEAYTEIPQEIYKIWYYPEEEKEIDFDKIDTSKVFMLELEFSKSISDNHLVNSKAKAPLGMVFGDWFMSFIENYNHKFDQEPIQYLNNDNTPHGWIFYIKPSFFGTPKYIDPDISVSENRISEKNVIIARRVGLV